MAQRNTRKDIWRWGMCLQEPAAQVAPNVPLPAGAQTSVLPLSPGCGLDLVTCSSDQNGQK